MAGYAAFTFVSSFFILGLFGFIYILIKPFVTMLVTWGSSLAPSLAWMFNAIDLCYTYAPLGLIIAVVIYFITNSQSMEQ